MSHNTPCIALTAAGGGVGESVLRALSLSSKAFRVIGIDADPWSAGLFVASQAYIIPKANDVGYVTALIDILSAERGQVLIPGSDPEIEVLGNARAVIEEKSDCIVLVGSPKCTELCRDKLTSSTFFRSNGFPFASTVALQEALIFAREVGFPLVVKPRGGSASRGVRIVFNAHELECLLSTAHNVVVQEYLIPQCWNLSKSELKPYHVLGSQGLRQEEEISVQVLFDHLGELLGVFTSRNVLRDGVPVRIDPWPKAPVETTALEMAFVLRENGLIGPCNFQCKLTQSGPVFFEVNPRFTGITAVRAALGFNEVDAVLRRVLFHEPISEVRDS